MLKFIAGFGVCADAALIIGIIANSDHRDIPWWIGVPMGIGLDVLLFGGIAVAVWALCSKSKDRTDPALREG